MADAIVGAMFDEFVVGGLLDDADVTLRTVRFRSWDYNGNIKEPVLGLQFEMVEDDGTVTVDVGSAGELKIFQPSPDGKKAVPMGATKKLNQNTNAVLTLLSLMQADTRGELAAKLRATDDISILDGTKVHILRKPQPKRKNMPVITAPDMPAGQVQQKREQMYISIEKIISYPWETSPVATAAAPATATAAVATPAAAVQAAPVAAAAPAAGANVDIANAVLIDILAANGMSMPRAALAGQVFKNETMLKLPPAQKNAILGMMVGDAYLTGAAAAMGVKFDPAVGVISLG